MMCLQRDRMMRKVGEQVAQMDRRGRREKGRCLEYHATSRLASVAGNINPKEDRRGVF